MRQRTTGRTNRSTSSRLCSRAEPIEGSALLVPPTISSCECALLIPALLIPGPPLRLVLSIPLVLYALRSRHFFIVFPPSSTPDNCRLSTLGFAGFPTTISPICRRLNYIPRRRCPRPVEQPPLSLAKPRSTFELLAIPRSGRNVVLTTAISTILPQTLRNRPSLEPRPAPIPPWLIGKPLRSIQGRRRRLEWSPFDDLVRNVVLTTVISSILPRTLRNLPSLELRPALIAPLTYRQARRPISRPTPTFGLVAIARSGR